MFDPLNSHLAEQQHHNMRQSLWLCCSYIPLKNSQVSELSCLEETLQQLRYTIPYQKWEILRFSITIAAGFLPSTLPLGQCNTYFFHLFPLTALQGDTKSHQKKGPLSKAALSAVKALALAVFCLALVESWSWKLGKQEPKGVPLKYVGCRLLEEKKHMHLLGGIIIVPSKVI